MPDPLTIEEILELREKELERREKLRNTKKKKGSLSDKKKQTTTVNIPPPAAIFCIISWNIQTFEAGKAMRSPFVNIVINGILEALSADVCILLETRSESYMNMNAIETGHEGDGTWKPVATDDEDDDVVGGDVDDDDMGADDDDDSDDADDNDEDLTYHQLASEKTGKRWNPPGRIFLYHPDNLERSGKLKDGKRFWALAKDIADQANLNSSQVVVPLWTVASAKGTTQKNFLPLLAAKLNPTPPVKKNKKSKAKKVSVLDLNMTVKNRNALLKLSRKLAKDPTQWDGLDNVSSSVKKFASDYQFHPKLLKGFCVDNKNRLTDTWKGVLQSDGAWPLRKYYELSLLDANTLKESKHTLTWDQIPNIQPSDWYRVVLRRKKCEDCDESLGTGTCDTCSELGPYTTAIENLQQAVNHVTFYRSSQQETYSILIRPSLNVFGSTTEGTWLTGKRVQVFSTASKLLMYAPDEELKKKGKIVIREGGLLKFQESGSAFYGRCPFTFPVGLWLDNSDERLIVPIVTFHGPFGKSTLAGIQARADSMIELMQASVGPSGGQAPSLQHRDIGRSLVDSPRGIVLGDFNLDWTPKGKAESGQKIANTLFSKFDKLDFEPMIKGGVSSSLISIYGKSGDWKYTTKQSTSVFTSSAYDNLFMKDKVLRKEHLNSCVIDVISWMAKDLTKFKLSKDDKPEGYDLWHAKTKAFYIYHKYVSDHLPILCDIVVQGMPQTSEAAQHEIKKLESRKKVAQIRQWALELEYLLLFDKVIRLEEEDDDAVEGCRMSEDQKGRYAELVGTVMDHVEDELMIMCEGAPKQQLHLSIMLVAPNGKKLSKTDLKRQLKDFAIGSKVRVVVLNPNVSELSKKVL